MMSTNTCSYLILAFVLIACSFYTASAQQQLSKNARLKSADSRFPSINTVKAGPDDNIRLDGTLDEPVWQRASAASGFIQRTPDDGRTATEKTEARF